MRLVTIAPGHQLDEPAAASFLRAVAAGCPVAITSSYRSPERQAQMRREYLAGTRIAYVAPVEKSEHVRGQALDLRDPAIGWMRQHPSYGWVFTDSSERWHVAYRPALDRQVPPPTAPAPAVAAPAPSTARSLNVDFLLIRTPTEGDGVAHEGPGAVFKVWNDGHVTHVTPQEWALFNMVHEDLPTRGDLARGQVDELAAAIARKA